MTVPPSPAQMDASGAAQARGASAAEALRHGEGPLALQARRQRLRLLVAGVLAAVMVLGGWGVAHARWSSDQNARLAVARASFTAARAEAEAASGAAQGALQASEGKVADGAREQLAAALAARPDRAASLTSGSRAEQIASLSDLAQATARWTGSTREATLALIDALAAWELAGAQASYSEAAESLRSAILVADAALTGSEGEVADDSVRQELAAAAADASGLLEAAAPAGVFALNTASTAAASALAVLTEATNAVGGAHAEWQAEQARSAAAAAAQVRPGSSSQGSSARPGTSTMPQPSAAPSGLAGGPQTVGGWDTANDDVVTRCMDTVGATWAC